MTTLEKTEFIAGPMINELQKRGYQAMVEQTGGGTATLYAWKGESDEKIVAGPGTFNWKDSAMSIFTTDEFYVGEDTFTRAGEEKEYEPDFISVTGDADVKVICNAIEAEYAKINKN